MNLNLSNLPGAFGETETKPDMESGVSEIDANLLDEFAGHPYSVNDDEAMDDLDCRGDQSATEQQNETRYEQAHYKCEPATATGAPTPPGSSAWTACPRWCATWTTTRP